MTKKKGKRHNRNQAGKKHAEVSSEEEEDGSECHEVTKKCPHLSKCVKLKQLQNTIPHTNLGECGSCKAEAVCICLRCSRLGCDRSSEGQHALHHYKAVPSHPVTLHLQNWVVWCYQCDMDIPVQPNTELQRCITLLLKALKLNAPQDKQPVIQTPDTPHASSISKKSTQSSKGLQLDNSKIKGLANLGNTCFFNAVMQNLCQTELLKVAMSCISHEDFSQEIQPRDGSLPRISVHIRGLPGPLTLALGKLFKDVGNSTQRTLNPRELFNEICKKAPRFSGYRQQDSQELLRYLLDSVKTEELKRVKTAILRSFSVNEPEDAKNLQEKAKQKIKDYGACAQTPVVDSVFAGRLVSIVQCHECHQESLVQETFLDLSLPLTTPQKGKKAGKGRRSSTKGQKRSDKDGGLPKEGGTKSYDENDEEDEGDGEDGSGTKMADSEYEDGTRAPDAQHEEGTRAPDVEHEDEFARMNVSNIEKDNDGGKLNDSRAKENEEAASEEREGEKKENEKAKDKEQMESEGGKTIGNLEEQDGRDVEKDKEGIQEKNEKCERSERRDMVAIKMAGEGDQKEEEGGRGESGEEKERKEEDGKGMGILDNTEGDEREENGEGIDAQILDEGAAKGKEISEVGSCSDTTTQQNGEKAMAGEENRFASHSVAPLKMEGRDGGVIAPECEERNVAETATRTCENGDSAFCASERSVTESIKDMVLNTKDRNDCQRTQGSAYGDGSVAVDETLERDNDDICGKVDSINEIETDSGGKNSFFETVAECNDVNMHSEAVRLLPARSVENEYAECEHSRGKCSGTSVLESSETRKDNPDAHNRCRECEQQCESKTTALLRNSEEQNCEDSAGYENTENHHSESHKSLENSAENSCLLEERPSQNTPNVEPGSAVFRENSGQDNFTENVCEIHPDTEGSDEECESPGLNSDTVAPFYEAKEGELTVMSCLSHFCAPELLEGRNKFACGECTKRAAKNANSANEERDSSSDDGNKGAKAIRPKATERKKQPVYTEATKQLLVAHAPPVLTLHFKRFQQVGFGLRKVTKHVDFPLLLDLAGFCSKLGEIRADSNGRVMYSLYGVVEHSGGMNSGHYTAYVKMRHTPVKGMFDKISTVSQLTSFLKGMWSRKSTGRSRDARCQHSGAPEGSWFYVSDSHVSAVSEGTVLKRQAYMLFYERLPLLTC